MSVQGNLYIAEEDIKNIPCFAEETLVHLEP
jgi:hypothetical protein